jgi:hypothetical protein
MLAVGSKPGGPFARIDKGTYTLADAPTAATTSATREPAPPKRTRTRKTATRSKSKSASPTRTRNSSRHTR